MCYLPLFANLPRSTCSPSTANDVGVAYAIPDVDAEEEDCAALT